MQLGPVSSGLRPAAPQRQAAPVCAPTDGFCQTAQSVIEQSNRDVQAILADMARSQREATERTLATVKNDTPPPAGDQPFIWAASSGGQLSGSQQGTVSKLVKKGVDPGYARQLVLSNDQFKINLLS